LYRRLRDLHADSVQVNVVLRPHRKIGGSGLTRRQDQRRPALARRHRGLEPQNGPARRARS
jgi:hypothetical protein